MKSSTTFLLVSIIAIVSAVDPICPPDYQICGGVICVFQGDTVFCGEDGTCQANATNGLITAGLSTEDALRESGCLEPQNKCGNFTTFCDFSQGQQCQEGSNVCAIPTPSPTRAPVVTCEELGFCQDGSEACVQYLDGRTSSQCITLEELCSPDDKTTICSSTTVANSNNDVTYYWNGYNYDQEGWGPNTLSTTADTICSVANKLECDDKSGSAKTKTTTIISARRAVVSFGIALMLSFLF